MLNNPYATDAAKQRMIYLYVIEEKSQAQIAKEFGCTRAWVSLVLKAANVPIRRKWSHYKSQIKPKTEEQIRKEAEKELGFRRCPSCKLLKIASEDFYAKSQSRCKECNNQNSISYQRTEKRKIAARKWQQANKDKISAAQRRYYQKRKAQQEAETS